jgi:hypothetical protein
MPSFRSVALPVQTHTARKLGVPQTIAKDPAMTVLLLLRIFSMYEHELTTSPFQVSVAKLIALHHLIRAADDTGESRE